MRSIISTTALLLLLVPLSGVLSQEPRLSYHLDPGMRCTLDIDIQQNTRSESDYSEDINMYCRMKIDFKVDSIDAYGLIHLSVRYRDLLLSMLAPGLGLDINSGSGRNPVLAGLVDTLQRQVFRVSMDASGELNTLQGLDRIFGTMASCPNAAPDEREVILNTLNEAYGPNAFRGLFNLFVAYFPAIQPIRNWTRDMTFYFNTKPVQMANRYYLNRTSGDLMIIQGMGMLNSAEPLIEDVPLGKVESSVSGSQTYDLQVFRNTGWLAKAVSRQRVLIETTVLESEHLPRGLRIPSYTETVFEVKGKVAEP
jgi:hypothetical protein